jgi:hypothetical protein
MALAKNEEVIEFIVDDSNDMNAYSGGFNNGVRLTRWQSTLLMIKEVLFFSNKFQLSQILACVPIERLEIKFLMHFEPISVQRRGVSPETFLDNGISIYSHDYSLESN